MLVIGRSVGESVRIGEAVVTVQRSGRGSIRLAIDAPPHVRVVRLELEEKQNLNRGGRGERGGEDAIQHGPANGD